jgi:hypothetical protein
MPWDISFDAWGLQFYPSRINFSFSEAHDTGMVITKGRHKNQPANYGSAVIQVPPNIPNEERITYLVNIVLPIMPDILKAGATDCKLDIARYYSTQCNEELTADEIALIARLRCPLTYSAYQGSEEEELEMQAKLEDY